MRRGLQIHQIAARYDGSPSARGHCVYTLDLLGNGILEELNGHTDDDDVNMQ